MILFLLLLTINTAAADEWVTVRSKNFHLIGNANESDIRSVAVKLEQFRHVFGYLFPDIKLTDPVETNVIVFKDTASYEPFLPKTPGGQPDRAIAGYFLGDNEANYITLSISGTGKDKFEIIFHEYVHFLLNNNFKRSEIPPWLSEGLAEYYSTFEIENNSTARLGNIRNDHLRLLSSNTFIPLRQFFGTDNYSLHKNGDHSRSMFYAQAWALVHYFSVRDESYRLSNFVELSRQYSDTEVAFKLAFGKNYEEMEAVLRAYVKQNAFTGITAKFKEKLMVETDLTSGPLSESDALGFKGDLYYRMKEFKLAENMLAKALTADPDQVRANTAMGLVKLRLNKKEDAKKYLAKAVAKESSGYYANFSYAYLLSRETMSSTGRVNAYETAKAEQMRSYLRKAIELNPEFIESYNLYAFINIVTETDLDTAVAFLKKALAMQPGSERVLMNLAQAYIRQHKFDEADLIANGIIESTIDETLRDLATIVLRNSLARRSVESRKLESLMRFENGSNPNGDDSKKRRKLTETEVEEIRAERFMSQLNGEILNPLPGEQFAIGYFEKTACRGNSVKYVFKTRDGLTLELTSSGFQNLRLLSIVHMAESKSFGCGFEAAAISAVVNYRNLQSKSGVLTAVTFVPSNFHLKSKNEIARDRNVIYFRHPETGFTQAFEDLPDIDK